MSREHRRRAGESKWAHKTSALASALLGLAAVLLASCAAQHEQQQAGGAQTSGDSGSGGLQEVVVTGSRVEESHDIRTMPREYAQRSKAPAAASAGQLEAAMQPHAAQQKIAEPGAAFSGADPSDEIWVIQTAAKRADVETDDDSPGSGTMLALMSSPHERASEPKEIPLPLQHTDVHATISGYIGTVDVEQQFQNPYDEKIEAVYLFPLQEKAAVSEFVMTIGERKIRGILREKEEARQIYEDARAQGYRASLLVQHRPNVFEQKVANIEPGKRIDVNIRYFHTLAYEDGWYSFVFPTVVGPRYNPVGSSDPVAALPREHAAEPARGTAVRYLRPRERSAHDVSIAVDVDAGVAIEQLASTHEITMSRDGANRAHVELASRATMPNRDFVLKFRVAGDKIKSSLLTYTDPETKQGYFTLMMYPPADLAALKRRPVEMVFVVDVSGSMSGRPLEQATEAVRMALDRLEPGDTFQILSFAADVQAMAERPLLATRENLALGWRYLHSMQAGGGTEMLKGITAALRAPHDAERTRYVAFLTDGYIGNEVQILSEVHASLGDARIFSFGVGTAVNRFLLDGLAAEGRGAAAYLGLDASAEQVMAFYFDRVSHPALTDVAIDWHGVTVSDVFPAKLPDLFVGRPVVVTGKFSGTPDGVTVRGMAGRDAVAFTLGAESGTRPEPALRNIWARLKIDDLARRQAWAPESNGELASSIRATALEYGLMSAYTSFVAVDARERTAGNRGTTVHQAVPVPAGVRYETVVEH